MRLRPLRMRPRRSCGLRGISTADCPRNCAPAGSFAGATLHFWLIRFRRVGQGHHLQFGGQPHELTGNAEMAESVAPASNETNPKEAPDYDGGTRPGLPVPFGGNL